MLLRFLNTPIEIFTLSNNVLAILPRLFLHILPSLSFLARSWFKFSRLFAECTKSITSQQQTSKTRFLNTLNLILVIVNKYLPNHVSHSFSSPLDEIITVIVSSIHDIDVMAGSQTLRDDNSVRENQGYAFLLKCHCHLGPFTHVKELPMTNKRNCFNDQTGKFSCILQGLWTHVTADTWTM